VEHDKQPAIVAENGLGRYQQSVTLGRHQLIADEPESVGGSDAGPAPFDFLCAGLGACTSITLRMFAERRGMALEKISVRVQQHRETQEDKSVLTVFEREITLIGTLSPEDRLRLLEIAGTCPVHKTLEGSVAIRSRLID
jgi:putative redox protein